MRGVKNNCSQHRPTWTATSNSLAGNSQKMGNYEGQTELHNSIIMCSNLNHTIMGSNFCCLSGNFVIFWHPVMLVYLRSFDSTIMKWGNSWITPLGIVLKGCRYDASVHQVCIKIIKWPTKIQGVHPLSALDVQLDQFLFFSFEYINYEYFWKLLLAMIKKYFKSLNQLQQILLLLKISKPENYPLGG